MAIPELERVRVEALLKKFAARVPPHAQKELWYEFTIRGNTVTLIAATSTAASTSSSRSPQPDT
jgi:hypothetical protein